MAQVASNLALIAQGTGQLGKLVSTLENHLKELGAPEEEIQAVREDLEAWAASIKETTTAALKDLEEAVFVAKCSVLKDTSLPPEKKLEVFRKLDKLIIQPSFWLNFVAHGFNFPTVLNTMLMVFFLIYLMMVG